MLILEKTNKLIEAVCNQSTHNLCLKEKKEGNVYPCKSKFYYVSWFRRDLNRRSTLKLYKNSPILISIVSQVMRKHAFEYAKIKAQISCMVTVQLIGAFIFASYIVQSLSFLNPKFQEPSSVVVQPGLCRT